MTSAADTVRAMLEQKIKESAEAYAYFHDQLALFDHNQGINDRIDLLSLTSTNFETLFLSGIVNSSLVTDTLTLPSKNLYTAYKTFYSPYFCINYALDYQPFHKSKTPMVYYVPNSITRVNAVLKKLITAPQPLLYHTTFSATIRTWITALSMPPQKDKIIQICIKTLKTNLMKKKCYDKHVKLSQPLLTITAKKCNVKKGRPSGSTTTTKTKKLPNSPYFEQLSQCYHASANGHSMPNPATQGEI